MANNLKKARFSRNVLLVIGLIIIAVVAFLLIQRFSADSTKSQCVEKMPVLIAEGQRQVNVKVQGPRLKVGFLKYAYPILWAASEVDKFLNKASVKLFFTGKICRAAGSTQTRACLPSVDNIIISRQSQKIPFGLYQLDTVCTVGKKTSTKSAFYIGRPMDNTAQVQILKRIGATTALPLSKARNAFSQNISYPLKTTTIVTTTVLSDGGSSTKTTATSENTIKTQTAANAIFRSFLENPLNITVKNVAKSLIEM